jgi:hypothetical protein
MTPLRPGLAKGGAAAARSLPLSGLTLTCTLFALTPAAHAATPEGPRFSIAPAVGTHAYVIADARPGALVRRTLRVVNTGTSAGAVRLYAVDAATGVTSGAVYRGEHAPRSSVGAWTRVSEGRLQLAPGASRIVHIAVRVPRSARPGQHLGAVVAENATVTRGRSVKRGKGALRVDVRLLTVDAVQVNLPGKRFTHVSLTGADSGGAHGRQSVLVGIRNDGTELVKPRGSFELRDDSGRVLMRTPLKLDTLVPDSSIPYPVEVTGRALSAGTYRVTVELRHRDGIARRTMPLTISDENVEQVFKSRPDLAPPGREGLGQNAWLLGFAGLGGGLGIAAAAARLRRRGAA